MAGACGERSSGTESERDTKCGSRTKSKSASSGNESETEKDAFGRNVCPQKTEEEKEIECHESVKKFFEKDAKSESKKRESECEEQEETKSEDSSDSDKCLKMPHPQVMTMKPCLPKVEKGISAKGRSNVCCVTRKRNCPQLRAPSKAEFFCIDARNQKMNECLKQYMTLDPSQVNIQCAQFAPRKRMHTATQPPPAAAGFFPPKYRQIMRRWLPAAGLYMAATAAVAVWVTEWGPVVNQIPFYRAHEEQNIQKKPPPESEPPELESSSPESQPPALESSESSE